VSDVGIPFLQFFLYGYGIISSCDGQKFVNFHIEGLLIAGIIFFEDKYLTVIGGYDSLAFRY
jgi:hypothetical protein